MAQKKPVKNDSNSVPTKSWFYNALVVLAWILSSISIILGLFSVPWSTAPLTEIPFSFKVAHYNFSLLLHLKGGFVRTIWGYLVFLSISTWFYTSGQFAFSKILKWVGADQPTEISSAERIAIRWLLGSWICGMLWFLLGQLGLFTFSIGFYSVVLGLLVLGFFSLRHIKRAQWSYSDFNFKLDKSTVFFVIVFLWIFSWTFSCGYPQYYWDTLMTDWALPGFYVAESKLAINPFHVYSYHAQNSQLLIVWTLLAKSREASYLIVWGFFAALVFLVYGWISRTACKAAALCAIGVLSACEIGIWLGTLIKNDLQLAVFLILQWWALTHAFKAHLDQKGGTGKWVTVSGLFAGIALGHKFTGAPAVFITVLGVFAFFLFCSSESKARRILDSAKMMLFFTAGLLVAWSPWLVRNFVATGNPVYPFLNGLFGTKPIYDWHVYTLTKYTLVDKGFAGVIDYFENLTWLKPTGGRMWWGPLAWVSFLGFLSITSLLTPEIRWICSIGITSWFFSLFFALKPPYHAGPLILVMVCCFGWVAGQLFKIQNKKIVSLPIVVAIILNFAQTIAFKSSEKTFQINKRWCQ